MSVQYGFYTRHNFPAKVYLIRISVYSFFSKLFLFIILRLIKREKKRESQRLEFSPFQSLFFFCAVFFFHFTISASIQISLSPFTSLLPFFSLSISISPFHLVSLSLSLFLSPQSPFSLFSRILTYTSLTFFLFYNRFCPLHLSSLTHELLMIQSLSSFSLSLPPFIASPHPFLQHASFTHLSPHTLTSFLFFSPYSPSLSPHTPAILSRNFWGCTLSLPALYSSQGIFFFLSVFFFSLNFRVLCSSSSPPSSSLSNSTQRDRDFLYFIPPLFHRSGVEGIPPPSMSEEWGMRKYCTSEVFRRDRRRKGREKRERERERERERV